MTEPASGAAAGVAFAKLGGAALIAAGLMFMVAWPKTRREGVSRIVCTLAGSTLFGRPLLAYVHTTFAWWPREHEADMAVFVLAGLPAWWALGGLARWLDKRRETAADIKLPGGL